MDARALSETGAPFLDAPVVSANTKSQNAKSRNQKHMQNQMPGRNQFDQGPLPPDWTNLLPLGVTPPLFARCLETWLQTEHSNVIETITHLSCQSAVIAVKAIPPRNNLPWTFQYRSLSDHPFDCFQLDPETRWSHAEEDDDELNFNIPPSQLHRADRSRSRLGFEAGRSEEAERSDADEPRRPSAGLGGVPDEFDEDLP